MKKLFLFALIACTSPERATKALEDAGYTNVTITGYDAFACSKGDSSCTGFRAIGPTGRPVKGAVGCGFGCGKSCTIRLD